MRTPLLNSCSSAIPSSSLHQPFQSWQCGRHSGTAVPMALSSSLHQNSYLSSVFRVDSADATPEQLFLGTVVFSSPTFLLQFFFQSWQCGRHSRTAVPRHCRLFFTYLLTSVLFSLFRVDSADAIFEQLFLGTVVLINLLISVLFSELTVRTPLLNSCSSVLSSSVTFLSLFYFQSWQCGRHSWPAVPGHCRLH